MPFVWDNILMYEFEGAGPRTMAKKIKQAPSTQIGVIAEGKDESARRYFLLGVGGKPIPSFHLCLRADFQPTKMRFQAR